MSKKLGIQEFFIEGNDKKNSHVLLHITEPTTAKEKKHGYFLAVAEVEQGEKEQIKQVQNMIDQLESDFYASNQEFPRNFESILEQINQKTHKILREDSKLHCFVSAIKDGQISYSYHGQPQVFLFYNEKSGYNQLNLAEENHNQQNQIFSSVIEGNLQTGDTFYVGTPNIDKLLTKDRLKKTILNNNILQAAQDIQSSLTGFKPDLSFGGILFQLKKTQQKDKVIKNNQEDNNYRPTSRKNEQASLDILAKSGKLIVNSLKKLGEIIWSIVLKAKDFFLGLFLLITNRGGQRKTIIRSIKQSFRDRRQEFKELPFISKSLLIIALIAGLSFAGSLSYLKVKEAQKQQRQEIQNQVNQVQQKIKSAQTELIYDNNKKALKLLQTAQKKLKDLPNNLTGINSDLPNKDKLRGEITTKLNKARNITTVSSTLIAYLSQKTNQTNPNKLAFIKDKLVGYNPNSKQVYIVDKTTKNITKKEYTTIDKLKNDATPKENDYIVLGSDTRITKLQTDPYKFSLQEVNFPSDNTSIAGVSIYSRNLYTLDKNNNQIYKHSPTQGGFGSGEAWLKDKTKVNFDQANSLAIDGNIYVLKSNGSVEKFFLGEKKQFNISGVSPELSNPKEIWTYRDRDNIYILEPNHQRLVILNKKGKMKKQLRDNKWNKPTSMIIKEKENTGFVIDQGKIYKFPLKL